ncbi:MAG: TonB-dependent receptor [Myxococcota bacterium]
MTGFVSIFLLYFYLPFYVVPDVELEEIEDKPSVEFTTTIKEKKGNDLGGTADTVKIKGEEIQNSSRGTFLEAISQFSSDIYVTSSKSGFHGISSGASGGISVRGLGGSPNTQVLVVEDGIPDYQGIFGHPIPDAYVPELISSVEVIKGGDSVRYGSNAMGAVIILNPYFKRDAGAELQTDTAIGSFNTLRNRIILSIRTTGLSYNIAISHINSDGHRDYAGGTTNVIGATTQYEINDKLRVSLFEKFVSIDGYDPGPAPHPFINHFYNVYRNNFHLKLEYERENIKTSIIPFINGGEHRLYDGFRSYDYAAGLITEINIKFINYIQSTFGISSINSGGSAENIISGYQSDRKDLSGYAIYNQTVLRLPFKLSIQAGLREHYSPTYQDFFLYQFGLLYNFYTDLYFRTRISKNFRQPTIRELYLPFPVANPDLKPETSLNRDISLGYNDGTFNTEITYYKTYAKNLIKYFGAWPTAEVVNIDEYEVPGLEANIGLNNPLGMSLNISYDIQDVGRYTKQNPSRKLNIGFIYRGELKNNLYKFGLSMEYVSGLYENNYSRGPMKDVFFVDFFSGTDINTFKVPINLYLIIRNLLDIENEYIKDYPMPGINALLGLRIGI